jgi:hypothetical protein
MSISNLDLQSYLSHQDHLCSDGGLPSHPSLRLDADGCYEEAGLLVQLEPDEVAERLTRLIGKNAWDGKPFVGHVSHASFRLVQHNRGPLNELTGRIRRHAHGSVIEFRLEPLSMLANFSLGWVFVLSPLLALLAVWHHCVFQGAGGAGILVPGLVLEILAGLLIGAFLTGGLWLSGRMVGLSALSGLRRLYGLFDDVRIVTPVRVRH